MTHPEKELPNPFEVMDKAKDRLEQCELEIAELKQDIRLLRQCTITLLSLCNKRLSKNDKA